jgi:hypothetical protein
MEKDETSGTTTPEGPPRPPREENPLTILISALWPLIAGALVGVAMRVVFSGKPGFPFAAMDWSFIYLAPLAVGAVTVNIAETSRRRSWSYYFWAPVLANVLFVIGTIAVVLEGLICAVVAVPLFGFLGAVGGLIMGAICRATKWPRHAAYALTALPLLLGTVSPDKAPRYIGTVERTVLVEAPPAEIWRQIHNARNIESWEVERAWIYRIGVPLPIAGVTEQTPTGLVRKITMGKSVHFEQVVIEWEENRRVRWTYRFDADSFPPGALDDHVRIGGRYFDLVDTAYTLTPIDASSTALDIRMDYRLSTDFNWYANGVAQFLIGNFEGVILDFYKQRAVRAAETTRPM